MGKPIIGIVAKHYKKDYLRLETFIRDEVEQAIFDNGGIAIGILPPNEGKVKAKNGYHDQLTTTEKHNLYEQINLCDGIILQGGAFSDMHEIFIAKYCYECDIPLLGICAGSHNLTRALGGTVSEVNSNLNHKSEEKYVHSINIDKEAKFYNIIGKDQLMVNSRHKKYASDTGLLNVAAYSKDGISEVLEDASKRFYIGVQFHPESLYKIDENMNKIFIGFISECNKKR